VHQRSIDDSIKFLYREYYQLLSRYIINNNGGQQDAEDIFQEVVVSFINLVRAGKFRGEASIKTFLFSLNRNLWLNELKRKGRMKTREEKYERVNEKTEQSIDLAIESREAKGELQKSINALGEACKTILLLFYFENRSMKEILEYLDYENEQVLRNKKHKCMKRLQEIISSNNLLYQQLKRFLNG
jgi:RNA polymerase sigma factor (sigma-70 family)